MKRLESSFYAFQVSLDNFCQANQNMIDMFERDKIFIAPDLDINMLLESGLSDEEIEEKLNAKAEDNPKMQYSLRLISNLNLLRCYTMTKTHLKSCVRHGRI